MKKFKNKIMTAYMNDELLDKLAKHFFLKKESIDKQVHRFLLNRISDRIRFSITKVYNEKQKIEELLNSRIGNYNDLTSIISNQERQNIINAADAYSEKNFNVLGSGPVQLDSIDWHIDFKSGYKWPPGKFYLDYKQVHLDNNADVKVVRELARSHHYLLLGQAYLLTGDEKYTLAFIEQITDFMKKNPFMKSINWGCSMDVAIRAANWIWALNFFMSSSKLTLHIIQKILISLYQHGYFIYKNPEKSGPINNHNHYVSDLAGQIFLGIIFQEIPKASNWLYKGIPELYREMRMQILPSGPSYERSINYHRLVLEFFLWTINLLKKNKFEVPSDIDYRLEKMFEFVLYYTKPDGSAPVIGDQDDGRFLPFGIQKNIDHRYLLSIGAVIFDREDFKYHSGGYSLDCFFLSGIKSKTVFDSISKAPTKELISTKFPDAGFFILRQGKDYMFINLSGMSRYNELPVGTHTHSDLLSIELMLDGISILVDPGTYVYSANPKERMLFRSTKMHNTVVIDGHDQNILTENNLWGFERNAIPKLISCKISPTKDVFEGSHSGYQRLANPVIHRRKIIFDKKRCHWEIIDSFDGHGAHFFEWFFHFDLLLRVEISEKKLFIKTPEKKVATFEFLTEEDTTIKKEIGWISKAYGDKKKAVIVKMDIKQKHCPFTLKMVIKKEDYEADI